MSDYLKDGFIDEVVGCLGKEESGSGQANVIESIKVNGVDQSVDSNKSVDIPVPTKTSDLDNDSGYMTEDQVNSKVTEGVDVILEDVDEIKSNLDELGYGENQGGSNIAWISKERVISDIGVQATYFDGGVSISQNGTYKNFQIKVPCKRNTKYNYGLKGYSNGNLKQFTIGSGIGYSWGNIIERYIFTDSETLYSGSFSTGDYDFLTVTLYASNNIASGSMTIKNFYISETDMSYEPYIPSVNMLADEVSTQNESLSVIGKCKNLLNPTLQTTTLNGVTCTNNGDGTYTLNGTNNTDSSIWFVLTDSFTLEPNKKYKLVGAYPNSSRPFVDSTASWFLELYNLKTSLQYTRDYGDGRVFTITDTTLACEIGVRKGATLDNFTFKPMLTECLDATYDDFVPYTGDGDTLTHDVAELKNDLNELCNIEKVFNNENTTYTYTASEMHLENDHIYDIFLKGNYPTAGSGCCKVFIKNNQYVLFTIAAKYIEFSMDSSNGTLTVTNKYNGTQGTQLIVKKVV